MFNKDIQYISAIRYNTQLKIDYKKFHNNEIDSMTQSNFLTQDELLPNDVAFKLNEWQKEINDTYLITLCSDDSQRVVSKNESKRLKEYTSAFLNENQDLVIKKDRLFEEKHYFEKTGIDYIFSPFQVLNLHCEQNPSANTLFLLTINSISYVVILNAKGEIDYSKVLGLTSFEHIQETNFFENEVVGQKLFDEVYYLELLKNINECIKEYYGKKSGSFIERVSVLYTLKQLNDEQLKHLQDELMIEVSYHAISLSESLHDLARDKDASAKSFTRVRSKKESSSSGMLVTIILLLAMIFGIYFYFEQEIHRFIKQEKILLTQQKKEQKVKPKEMVKLPNHINKNRLIEQHVLTFIDSIPYNVILKQLEIKKDNSILVLNMLEDDVFIKSMQPRYLEVYKYSNIKFKDDKATILEATIYNNDMLANLYASNEKDVEYLSDEFMPIKRVTEHLRAIFPPDAIITFQSKFKSEVMTYNYLVNMVVQNPMQFFDFVEDINKELYSINVNYPVLFIKTEDGIEVEFNLQFHQLN